MNNLNYILNRRSVRKYKNEQVPENLIEDLLRAAMNAPSAANQQPWHFVVITDREALNEISNIHGGYACLKNSPLAILVCAEPDAAKLKFYYQYDCAAATQNILLAAGSVGLGAVWLGISPTSDKESSIITRVLNIPKHIKPFSLVSVGFPDEAPEPADRFNKEKIHYNKVW